MKHRSTLAVLLALVLALMPLTPVMAATEMPPELLEALKQYIAENYVDEITVEDLTGDTPEEVFQHLDQHSVYYSPKEFEKYMERLSGEYAGIGAFVQEIDGKIIITEPIEGSPSHRAGLKPGDEVIYIDNVKVQGMTVSEAVALIRGPEGSKVTLKILRAGYDDLLEFTMTREFITMKTVNYEIMEDVGYLRILEFNETTYDETNAAILKFKQANIDRVIIDLRDNPGGRLDSVLSIARMFINRGPIVHVEYRNNAVTYNSFLGRKQFEHVAVLTNEGSASAAEILAAAIQDSGTGVIIGKTTYGKGTVQRIYSLEEYGGFKLTEARYLSPNKKVIDGVGVIPDYEVERFPDSFNIGNIVSRKATRDIAMGQRGPEVVGIQHRLRALGYTITDSSGVFRQSTMDALIAFSADHGLEEPTQLTVELQKAVYKAFEEELFRTENDQQLNFALDYLRGTETQRIAK